MASQRDNELAHKGKAHKAAYSLRIVIEARRADIPISLGFAVVEQESGFRNVFGRDPTSSIPDAWKGKQVTKARYQHYKRNRSSGGMQGVGPCQLTWWAYQDAADHLGGCWIAKNNIRVAFEHLAALMRQHGTRDGIRRYNGSGPAAEQYADSVLRRRRKWHDWLT